MKIGFSFGRCVRDIVEGKVQITDIVCIISRTYITHENQISEIIADYSYRPEYLAGLDLQKCIEVALDIYMRGLLHQPRAVGAHAPRIAETFVWMDLMPTTISDNPIVEKAWRDYLMALKLTSTEALPSDPGSNIASYNYSYSDQDVVLAKALDVKLDIMDNSDYSI
jgi:hypothetical protein